jgi:hypothetical protein
MDLQYIFYYNVKQYYMHFEKSALAFLFDDNILYEPMEQGIWNIAYIYILQDRLCGLVVRVLGYRYGGPGSIPGTIRFSGEGGKENK